MLDDAHLALMPSRELRDELRDMQMKDPRLPALAHSPRGEPQPGAIITLKNQAGAVVFQMVEVPVPDVAGHLYVGQLPGRASPLAGELDGLTAFGVRHIYGLLPRLDLDDLYRVPRYVEEAQARFGERFHLLDVIDYEVPPDDAAFEAAVADAERALVSGDKVYCHCGAGCGRAGVFVACVLVRRGVPPLAAVEAFRSIRGCGPETGDQVAFVVRFAERLASAAQRG